MRKLHTIWLMGVVVGLSGCTMSTTWGGKGGANGNAKAGESFEKWTWTTTRNADTYTMAVKIKQQGDKLTGVYVSREGNEFPIKDGKVAGGKISFTVPRDLNGQKVIYHYEGKIEGDKLTGTIESDRSGEKKSRDWEATRAKS
jgi:hypothetical protein